MSAVILKKLSWSLRSTAKRRGLHVESERWEGKNSKLTVFPEFLELLSFCLLKLTQTVDLQLMGVTIGSRIYHYRLVY